MARGPVMGPRGMIGSVPVRPFAPRGPFVRGGVVRRGPFFQGGAFVPGYSYPFYNSYYSYNVYPPAVESPYDIVSPSTAYGSVEAQPAQTNMGGLSFDVTPSTAELFVDKMLVGTVGQFTSMTQPLGLEAGSHHIELSAPDYQMLSFDVDIVAGEVIPYQGTLER
jgi:hypothetical protein